ncbi:unnamed protein product, partial [Pseudo-nitzschia multistriata]
IRATDQVPPGASLYARPSPLLTQAVVASMESTAEPSPTCYMDLFQDPAANPFGTDPAIRRSAYARIYQKFASGPGPLPPDVLYTHTLNLFEAEAIGGISIFVNDANGIPRLCVIHGIRKYPGCLLAASPNANKTFGFLDDVVSGRGELVRVTTSMFALTSAIRVLPIAGHCLALEADANLQYVGPHDPGDPNTEEVVCRHTFFLPFELVPLVLGKDQNPREAFCILHPWLQSRGWDAEAKPLVDALRVAGTQARANTPANPRPICETAANEPGPLFRAEAKLTIYMDKKVLHRDLPGLVPIPTHVNPGTAALTAAVSTLTDNQLKMNEANERRRAEETKPASMEDVFGALNVSRLLSLCLVEQDSDLPGIYQGWTSKKKGEKLHALFQSYVDQSARELGLQAPFVPTSILKTFQAFRFYGVDECNVGDGILPMAFAPPGGSPTARKRQMEDAQAALAYDTLVSTEGNSLNLSDALTLGKSQGYVPLDWTEALLQIEGYLPVLATIAGVEHPLVRSYLDGLERLKRTQLALSWLPVVTDVPALKGLKRTAGLTNNTRAAGKGNSPGKGSGRSSRNEPTSTAGTPQQQVENNQQDPRLANTSGELGARIKSWKISKAISTMKEKGKGPCQRADGKEMCHSWRAKGFCYDGCKLGYDHSPLADEDQDRFWDWCQEAYGSQETECLVAKLPEGVAEPHIPPATARATTYPPDRLDQHVAKAVEAFLKAPTWGDFVRSVRGRGDLHPDVDRLPHPAAGLLKRFQLEGTPARMKGPPWGPGRIAAALARGPHKSSHNGIEFLCEEYADMMDKQQWTVLPAKLVANIPGLQLSPLGLVPQRGCRDRMISDYSYFSMNNDTVPIAPEEAMQFGRALKRLLQRIHRANNHFGPVYMAKVDLSDGFYRLWVKPEDTISLAVLFPARAGEEPLIGIPLTNPMGWCSSPPNFSACTETIADLANGVLREPGGIQRMRKLPHRLDELSESVGELPLVTLATTDDLPQKEATAPFKQPLQYWDVYVDDFCGLVQGNVWTRRAVKRALFHSLDQVFRPLDSKDTPYRQEPASIKKLKKGDATWATSKVILGWLLNTQNKTISLPQLRIERLQHILRSISPHQKYARVADWHKLLGELRSMAIALPGSVGLFSLLQEALRHQEQGRSRLRLTGALHSFLADFRWLAEDLASRPTRIAELVPDVWPATIGACDAAGSGMGGVHFIPLPSGDIQPIYWRKQFPPWIRQELVSFSNPKELALEGMPVTEAAVFESDLSTIQKEMRSSVTEGYAKKKDAHWACWVDFCVSQGLDPLLTLSNDPVPYLQVFGARYQDGRISPSKKRARARTVSDALRSVGQKITRMGALDPRLNRFGNLDYRFAAQLRAYRNRESPLSRVKPIPITVIIHTLNFAYRQRPTAERKAVANMMCIAFFFCLRLGEYTGTTSDDQAFTLQDLAFFIGARRLHSATASDAEISAATSIQLTFTTQKNGVKGDVIAHSRSGDPLCCPVTASIRQFLLHRNASNHGYDGRLPLASYYNQHHTNVRVTAAMVTTTMRWHAAILQHATGICPKSLSARSLRAGGAMALLQGCCDSNVIKLLARWHSDAMMRYLHQQSVPLFRSLTKLMFNNGAYSFLPDESVPSATMVKSFSFFRIFASSAAISSMLSITRPVVAWTVRQNCRVALSSLASATGRLTRRKLSLETLSTLHGSSLLPGKSLRFDCLENVRRSTAKRFMVSNELGTEVSFRPGDKVQVEVVNFGPLGASVEVIGLGHGDDVPLLPVDAPEAYGYGLIMQREISFFRSARNNVDVVRGEILPAYVQKVRAEDGKLDISLRSYGGKAKSADAGTKILERLKEVGGRLEIGEKSSPQEINDEFPGISKSVFKKALGGLYKKGLVKPGPKLIKLMEK